ncbi:MAG: PH domain-containing protein [Bacilli bacterium]
METIKALSWTLLSECPIPKDITNLLVSGEQAIIAYKTFRDYAIFTNKRLLIKDSQNLTGKKVEIYSLPYTSINMWSTENSGLFDINSEVELWTKAGHIKIKLKSDIDIKKFDMIISNAVLC